MRLVWTRRYSFQYLNDWGGRACDIDVSFISAEVASVDNMIKENILAKISNLSSHFPMNGTGEMVTQWFAKQVVQADLDKKVVSLFLLFDSDLSYKIQMVADPL